MFVCRVAGLALGQRLCYRCNWLVCVRLCRAARALCTVSAGACGPGLRKGPVLSFLVSIGLRGHVGWNLHRRFRPCRMCHKDKSERALTTARDRASRWTQADIHITFGLILGICMAWAWPRVVR